ncbi:unnamed protein product [[Actinomadura] parvosata subsp. kistnae]|uniref:Uncharacterized protein n=1 Tax=[Actinomadura] parvosata subsp. kistnae TaxID=1909395 RepID=A0A1V0AD52_9ACTN|nr:hypothetical protein [Nonomuraea sp. ATCC 55076]AQZ68151.1 hypothetical protein BKM31_47780 [Nonomuraea sp. ATCC 55076]SPL93460.1 unnamed protein product [Actinomadura parvosata subsp. kistnae]
MPKRSHLALALACSAAVLCGCGGAAETAAQPSPAASAAVKDKRNQFEAAKADCMKQKGFKYVPYVRPTEPASEDERLRDSGDYQAMLKYRQKYGFGVFAVHVYPKEIQGPGSEMADPDPNADIQGSLSTAQLDAYNEAKNACMVVVGKQVLGLDLKSNMDYFNHMALAHRRAKTAELDGDPDLVELAATMSTCLKGKGYRVSDTKPTAVARRGENEFMERQSAIGREQDPKMAGGPKMTKNTKQLVMPTLTPQQARPYLDKEIKAALDDLECGKDFYAAYAPKAAEVQRRVNDEFAF